MLLHYLGKLKSHKFHLKLAVVTVVLSVFAGSSQTTCSEILQNPVIISQSVCLSHAGTSS